MDRSPDDTSSQRPRFPRENALTDRHSKRLHPLHLLPPPKHSEPGADILLTEKKRVI